MRRLYKKYRKLILATIPMAFIMAGAAIGFGAWLQGLTMLFMLIIAIGAILYTVIVANLVLIVEQLETEIAAYEQKERKRRQNKRAIIEYI